MLRQVHNVKFLIQKLGEMDYISFYSSVKDHREMKTYQLLKSFVVYRTRTSLQM